MALGPLPSKFLPNRNLPKQCLRRPTKKAYALKKEDLVKMLKSLHPSNFNKTKKFQDNVVNWRESAFLAMSFFLIARFADLVGSESESI